MILRPFPGIEKERKSCSVFPENCRCEGTPFGGPMYNIFDPIPFVFFPQEAAFLIRVSPLTPFPCRETFLPKAAGTLASSD